MSIDSASACWKVSVGWDNLHEMMHRRGWPVTKAGFLRAWFVHNQLAPLFPLDGETYAKVTRTCRGACRAARGRCIR